MYIQATPSVKTIAISWGTYISGVHVHVHVHVYTHTCTLGTCTHVHVHVTSNKHCFSKVQNYCTCIYMHEQSPKTQT